jgi:hypothetical protein
MINATAPNIGGPPPNVPPWARHPQAIQGDPNFQGPNMMPGYNPQAGGAQGMSDAMMHPFAPRNRPQFPGAMQGGIMGGMGGGPQMGPRGPGMQPAWLQNRLV